MKARPPKPEPDTTLRIDRSLSEENPAIICPVCGGVTVQEKCKVICKSEICRGRVIMNCAEF